MTTRPGQVGRGASIFPLGDVVGDSPPQRVRHGAFVRVRGYGVTGNRMWKVVPRPGSLSTTISPPLCSTMP